MSSFTPRSWKSQAEVQPPRHAEVPVGKFHAYRHGKPNNLPLPSTSFIGRERDVAEVKELLACHRLVTLVGSGGVGKTRLAVQVGFELLDGYPDGVWFVDLAPIADPELVSSVIAQTLGMSQQVGRRFEEAIPAWLQRKQLLLVFDNCEHLVEAIAPIASAILRTAQHLRILATSRQPLDIAGEKIERLRSLDVPGAIALFADRASLVDSSFALTDNTALVVADICRRLDGIPLAIELAAARVKVLSIPRLAERLNERFKLLTGRSRDALPRQKTLHALIDWSYDLLTAQEQLLFTRLGTFASGFGLDAATSVCGGEGLDELDILDVLSSLTDKSLVVADTTGDRERYRLLESTAAYAQEKLRESGEYETLARRHAEYYRDEAVAGDERYGTSSTFAWTAAAELELDNYRTALTWSLTQSNDTVLGAAIAGALGPLWTNAALTVEGRYWIERAVERVSESEHPRLAARLQLALSLLSSGKRKQDAAERSMRLYAQAGDARGAARAQSRLALALILIGDFDAARAATEQALSAAHACGDAWNVANCLDLRAGIDRSRGDVRAARENLGHALAAYKAHENEAAAVAVLISVAELDFADGHPDLALRSIRDALEIHLLGKNAELIACAYVNGASYRIALDDLDGAEEFARDALRVARQARLELFIAIAFQNLVLLAALAGDVRRAASLLGCVDARFAELGYKREYTERWVYDKLLTALREVLGEDEIAQLSAEGATWSEDRAVEEARPINH